jgi:hypothetical protein
MSLAPAASVPFGQVEAWTRMNPGIVHDGPEGPMEVVMILKLCRLR